MNVDINQAAPDDIDDDADLSAADRGNTVHDEEAAAARDAKGKFVKAADKDADTTVVAGEADTSENDDDKDLDGDAGSASGDDADGLDNGTIRLNKMKAQRDEARQLAAAHAARIAELAATPSDASNKAAADPITALNEKLDGMYTQVEEARADGDVKAAATLQRQIDAANRDIVKIEAERIAAKSTTEASESIRYDTILDAMEAHIDAINPKHDDFDPRAVKALEFYVTAHEKMGMPPSRALAAAAKVVFNYASGKEIVSTPGPREKTEKAAPLQRKLDVDKIVDINKRQPPNASNLGVNQEDKQLDPDALTDAEWDKLPKSKKAAMRGDAG